MYQQDRTWGDSYTDQVKNILSPLMIYLAEILVAPAYKDNKCATDFTVRLKGSDIAVRIRRADQPYRDLTIRSRRANGTKTELAKVKEGHGSHYFYGWTDENNVIAEWIFVDLDKVRTTGLLSKPRKEITNKDKQTSFISISIQELEEAGCLIDKRINTPGSPLRLISRIETALAAIDQTINTPEQEKPIIYIDPDMQAAEEEMERRETEAILMSLASCLICDKAFHSTTSYGICPQCWSKDRLREFDRWQNACTKATRANLSVSLTLLDWLTILSECTGKCAYCRVDWFSAIHMEDDTKGLVKGNVVPICKVCLEYKKIGWMSAIKRVRDYLDHGIPLFDPVEIEDFTL